MGSIPLAYISYLIIIKTNVIEITLNYLVALAFDQIAMRPATACAQCRIGKRRCDLTSGAGTCSPCARRNLPCSAGSTKTSSGNEQLLRTETMPPQSPQPRLAASAEEEILLVDLYFEFIHDLPHSLFHEDTFKRSVLEGTASKPVLLAMMGMSARSVYHERSLKVVHSPGFPYLTYYACSFATQPDVRARGAWYRTRARDALKEVLEQVSVETLQACILVGNNCMGDCDTDGESLYLGKRSSPYHIITKPQLRPSLRLGR